MDKIENKEKEMKKLKGDIEKKCYHDHINWEAWVVDGVGDRLNSTQRRNGHCTNCPATFTQVETLETEEFWD